MTTRLTLAILAAQLTAMGGTIVNIDATMNGCTTCSSPQNILPGTVVSIIGPKVQLSLGPGTYTIANADPNGSDYFAGWRFNGSPNWVWGFVVADDSTSTVLLDDYVSNVDSTLSAISNQTGTTTYDGNTLLSATSTAGFTDNLILSKATTVDFFIDDYYLLDNTGGVSLLVSGPLGTAPEPASIGLALAGLTAFAVALRKKRS